MNNVFFSSITFEWSTPQYIFDKLNDEFHFTLDVCATEDNKKVDKFYSLKDESLIQNWSNDICWCNPPYSRNLGKWVEKAYNSNTTVVMLLPARTDTIWFHNYCLKYSEIRFIKGRLKFGGSLNNAPFPSMICIFRGDNEIQTCYL